MSTAHCTINTFTFIICKNKVHFVRDTTVFLLLFKRISVLKFEIKGHGQEILYLSDCKKWAILHLKKYLIHFLSLNSNWRISVRLSSHNQVSHILNLIIHILEAYSKLYWKLYVGIFCFWSCNTNLKTPASRKTFRKKERNLGGIRFYLVESRMIQYENEVAYAYVHIR